MRRLNVLDAIKKILKDCFQLSSRMANPNHLHHPQQFHADVAVAQEGLVLLVDIEDKWNL